jgi:hypothetical protein
VSYHVYPVGDLIEHDTDGDDCVCGPTAEPVERDDGSLVFMMVHHSLDGREAHEARAPKRGTLRASLHELRCRRCRGTWRSWLRRLVWGSDSSTPAGYAET